MRWSTAPRMKLISWNVNGIRAVLKKPDLVALIADHSPDVLCLQETKARADQVELPTAFDSYHAFWSAAKKPGYSGVALFSKEKPIAVSEGLGIDDHDQEGRVLIAEYADYFIVTVYTPNSQSELRRLPYRDTWDEAFLAKMQQLEVKKPVIFCGDLNVAHLEIDLARPGPNRNKTPGFTDQERGRFSAALTAGFIDTFRHFQPDATERYSWWSYRGGARAKNVGWRLDYICISKALLPILQSAEIHQDIVGSDHCPVSVELA